MSEEDEPDTKPPVKRSRAVRQEHQRAVAVLLRADAAKLTEHANKMTQEALTLQNEANNLRVLAGNRTAYADTVDPDVKC